MPTHGMTEQASMSRIGDVIEKEPPRYRVDQLKKKYTMTSTIVGTPSSQATTYLPMSKSPVVKNGEGRI